MLEGIVEFCVFVLRMAIHLILLCHVAQYITIMSICL